jgi:hypothetical protein
MPQLAPGFIYRPFVIKVDASPALACCCTEASTRATRILISRKIARQGLSCYALRSREAISGF